MATVDEWREFEYAGQRWSFNSDELAMLDDEDGLFHFSAYHRLAEPSVETVIGFIAEVVKKTGCIPG